MYKNLPLYDLEIDDEVIGMFTISLVDEPAVESNFYAFSKEVDEMEVKCSVIDDGMEHRILACICRADFPILRVNENGKYYIRFSKETIQKMTQKFLKEGYQGAINLMHDHEAYVDGVELTQLFIKDTEKGISPKGFEEIEEGSLFGIYKIENDDVWKAIKNGLFKGVSLEGIFHPKEHVIDSLDELYDTLKN